MKKKNLIRSKQLYKDSFDSLCLAAAVIHELFMFSEDPDNVNHLCNMENDLMDLLHDIDNNGLKFVEKVPLNRKESI